MLISQPIMVITRGYVGTIAFSNTNSPLSIKGKKNITIHPMPISLDDLDLATEHSFTYNTP
ncbi:MAG: hypothetical protein COA73_14035 [Candidatus Hydrogenedentota bacterium]|nr:MAG: hypothetical protein COA73_14035 [Candidatus Hydrogenedentota bacterium]